MKYCAKCGAEMPDEMLQCSACGWTMPEELVYEQVPEETESEATAVQEPVILPKKKKNWPWMVLSLALVVLCAAAVWFFLLRDDASGEKGTKQQFVLSDAIDDSRDQLTGLFSNKTELQRFIYVLSERIASEEMTLTYTAASELDPVEAGIALQMNYSKASGVIDGDADLSIRYGENEADFALRFALKNDALQFTAPGLIDEVLEVKFSDTLQSALDLETYKGLSGALSKVLIEQLTDQLLDSIEATEETQEKILFGEEERECTLYTITYSEEIAEQLLQALGGEESMKDEEDAEQLTLQLIVCEGRIVGLVEHSGQDETVETNKMLLCGEENPWTDIRVYDDGEEVGNILIEQTENGFEVVVTDVEEASEVRFICDDKAQTFTIKDREADADVVMSYDVDGEDLILVLQMQNQEPITLKLSPLEKAPELLSDSATDIEQMSEMQSSVLIMSVLQNLKDNPQTTWIYDLLMNSVMAQ